MKSAGLNDRWYVDFGSKLNFKNYNNLKLYITLTSNSKIVWAKTLNITRTIKTQHLIYISKYQIKDKILKKYSVI